MTTATPIPELCDGCRDAVPSWLVRDTAVGVQLVCDDCYAASYQNSDRTDAWEADPIPPAATPVPISPELMNAMAEAARLSQKLRFLAGDVEAYLAEMKRRQMDHIAKDQIAALRQSLGIAESVLRESQAHRPILAEIALWKDGHAELERASSLLLRTVNDTLRHGLTLTARANLEDVCRQLAPLIRRELREVRDA